MSKTNKKLPVIIFTSQALFSVVGACSGYFIKPYHFSFINIWIGGVIGLIVGFIFGTVIFIYKKGKPSLHLMLTIAYQGIGAFFFMLILIFVVIPHFEGEAKRIKLMRRLTTMNLDKIEVYSRDGAKKLKTITNKEILNDFAETSKDTRGYAPNHPKYSRSWYLRIYAGNNLIEIDCHIMPKDNSTVYGRFVHRDHRYMRSFGSFSSKNLRKWFEEYIISH